jgi:hypothetical protein
VATRGGFAAAIAVQGIRDRQGSEDGGMAGEPVRVKIVNDVPAAGDTPEFTRGSELLVPSTTAAALILSGVAVQLRVRWSDLLWILVWGVLFATLAGLVTNSNGRGWGKGIVLGGLVDTLGHIIVAFFKPITTMVERFGAAWLLRSLKLRPLC